MIPILFATVFYTLLFVSVELIAKKTKLDQEVSRKLVHIIAGVSAALLPFVMSFQQIALLGLIFLPVMVVSKHLNIFSSIHQVKRNTYGEVYFPAAILITAVAFPQTVLYSYGLLVMGVSDGLASLFGQRYGRRSYRLGRAHKSYLGSLVFMVSTVLIGWIVLAAAGHAGFVIIASSIVLAAMLTAVEACASYGLDNLILPPVASGLLFVAITYLRV
jgi:dolichol kinase